MDKALNWLTVAQAAARSGYSVRYIRQLCREGKLSTSTVGRAYLIDPQSLSEYVLEMQRQGTGKHAPG